MKMLSVQIHLFHALVYKFLDFFTMTLIQFYYESLKSISTSAQYVTLDNKIKCLSLAVFFGNPTIKLWNCIYVVTTNSKPPGPIIMIDQSEILSRSQVQIFTLFFGGAQLCCSFYEPQQAAQIWCRKTNFVRHILKFSQ